MQRIQWSAIAFWLMALMALMALVALTAPAGGATIEIVAPSPMALTTVEQAYVRAHPVVTAVFVDAAIEPLQAWTADGRLSGIIAEYFAIVEQRSGMKIRALRVPTLAERDAEFLARRADILPLVLYGSPVAQTALNTAPFFEAAPIYLTRRDTTDFSASGRLGGLRVAVTPGSAFETFMRRRFPDAAFVSTASPLDELRAVATGRADVSVGQMPVAVYAIEKQLLANLSVRAFAEGAPSSYTMGVHAGETVLRDILDKALAGITPAQHRAIAAKWVPLRHLLDLDASQLLLNDAERAWVRTHRRVRVAYDREFAPFSEEHERTMQGLGPDLLREVTRRLGLEIVEERAGTWTEAYASVVGGHADMLVAAGRNDERRIDLQFVGPWVSSPTAIVTRRSVIGPLELGDLLDAPLAVQEQHFLIPSLRRKYPGLKLLLLPTQQEALAAVQRGDAGAAIGNIQVMSRLVQRLHPGELTISGQIVDGDSELFFAVPRAQPELGVILGKGLESISESDRSQLRQKWLAVNYEPGWPVRQVLLVFGPGLVIALLAVGLVRRANRRLRSEAAQRQRAQQQADASLQREQRVSESKSLFIASLSHEIRNPMAAIVSAAGLLRRRDIDADGRRLLAGIEQAGDGLLALLSRALDFSKAESGMLSTRVEWVEPRAWCQRFCGAYAALAASKGLWLSTQVDASPGLQAEFDPVRLGQVLSNLLSNAVKFCERGGVDVHLVLDEAAARLTLTVTDSGVGIPASELSRLFEPYSQLPSTSSRHAEGSGLGLALCREIVEHMGGRIDVRSDPGQGSRFEVDLPLACRVADAADGAAVAGPAEVASDWQREPVLVVDDDAVSLLVTSEQLREIGLQVTALDSGEAALEHWRRAPCSLVITDCHMPGVDGFELTRQIRQAPGVPGRRPWIVGLTGSTDADEHAQCRACGMDDVLIKPLRVAMLVERLRPATAES